MNNRDACDSGVENGMKIVDWIEAICIHLSILECIG